MRSGLSKLASLGLLAAAVIGCTPRFQGAEGFLSATTPVDYKADREKPDVWKGDPYANGGIADSTGGKQVRAQYGTGAKDKSDDKFDPVLNQPAKGLGQASGELPAYADPSRGNSNSPEAQPPMGMMGTAH